MSRLMINREQAQAILDSTRAFAVDNAAVRDPLTGEPATTFDRSRDDQIVDNMLRQLSPEAVYMIVKEALHATAAFPVWAH